MSPESCPDFGELPQEYQHLLRLAKEEHHLDVVPLTLLTGGQTGAFLYLASVSAGDLRRVDHLILKFDRVNQKTKQSEIDRHRNALGQAPASFAGEHMARLAYEVEHEGAVALFYGIAGQSLQRFRTLAAQERQSRLEILFGATNDYLVRKWNADAVFEQALHPRELLERWLGYRLRRDGRIASLLRDTFHISPDIEGFLIQGQVYPNPLGYGIDPARWKGARAIDALVGFQHGDLNIGNILAEFGESQDSLEGYFLIDFALYKAGMPLFYDQCYLEMSYLTRELNRAPLDRWVSLVDHFSSSDIPDPRAVPVELAGACAAIGAGRASFARWVQERHPSLADDLWGQYRLAAVAAGLNFCNKTAIPTAARLAGLVYGAAHLKRFCVTFGVPLPVDVRLLYEAGRWGTAEPIGGAVAPPDPRRTPLLVPPTPFIGRETDLKAVKDLLTGESVRLLVLTGPGGTGKTRLALQAAVEVTDRFDDGACFVDLAPILEPDAVLPAVARALGLRETSDRPLLDELKRQLAPRVTLLLLDNFEQVTAAAPVLGELLRDCPRLKLLVTSREALHVAGEHVFPVPPLAMPAADGKHASLEELISFDAIRLFVERARAVCPGFDLTDDNAPVVAEICSRLDGLPLAIELAAARLKLFSPLALLDRLRNRLKVLRGGARDLPERQQTLRDTIDWSYELLDKGEQRLFALLAVFAGCTLEAAEAVAGASEHPDVADMDVVEGLSSLLDKSLIRRSDRAAGESRLAMLETIREYATERLEEEPGFAAAVRLAHAAHFADFAHRHFGGLSGSQRETSLGALEAELENLRGAWRTWVAQRSFEQLQKLTDSLWLLYNARGWYHATVELASDLLNVLESTPSSPERVRQEIMLQTSLARALLAIRGYTPQVEQAYTRALDLCREGGEIPQLFSVLRGLSAFYVYRAEFDRGAELGQQLLSLAERVGDPDMCVDGHLVRGYSLAFHASLREGAEHLERGASLYDPNRPRAQSFRFGNDPGVTCCTTSALVLWMLGLPDRALGRARDAMRLAQRLEHPFTMAYALFHTGMFHLWRQEPEIVRERAQAALAIAEEHEYELWAASATCLHGAALASLGRGEEGLTQLRQGMEQYQGLRTRPPVFWPMLLSLEAGACALAGRIDEGLRSLDEAMAIAGRGYGTGVTSDFFRFRGELLLALSSDNAAESESCFQEALQIARDGEAAMLELRAATSLCRLWREQGRGEEGRQVLGDAYAKMTEGFTTADVREAGALLEECS